MDQPRIKKDFEDDHGRCPVNKYTYLMQLTSPEHMHLACMDLNLV